MVTSNEQKSEKIIHRSEEQILSDMIAYCKEKDSSKKSHIMYGCNLSFKQLNEYLEVAIKGNFLNEESGKYKEREKGGLFYKTCSLLQRLLITGKDEQEDPYTHSKLIPEIKTTVTSLDSITGLVKIPKSAEVDFFKRKRRDRYTIIQEALDRATGGSRKTRIMYGCNLSFAQVEKYLNELKETNMILFEEPEYDTTPKGKLFARTHKLGRKMLKSGGDRDPFIGPRLIARIDAALLPMLSVEIPEVTPVISI